MASQLFRNETILALDLFHKPFVRQDLEALAQTIQNLIIITPGTLPNDPLFGVGIERYLFELLNDDTITTIQNNIEEQIARYIVHEDITVTADVRSMRTNDKNINSLYVGVRLYESNALSQREDEDSEPVEFGFAYASNAKTQRTVSKIIL